MEIKINKDIREFSEIIFFGLSMRQFIFSFIACIVAVILYFVLKPFFGIETLSWVCVLGAAPFAVLGFVKYNGMTAEQFIWAWVKSEILIPSQLKFSADNIYYEMYKDNIKSNVTKTKVKKNRVKRKGRLDENIKEDI